MHNPVILGLLLLIEVEAGEMTVGYSQTVMKMLMIVLLDGYVDAGMWWNP